MDEKPLGLTASDAPTQVEPASNTIEPASEVESFMRQIQHDRLLKIYVGQDASQPPFHVQESTLVNSSNFFRNVVQHGQDNMGMEPGNLCFPEDRDMAQAWGVMLYWMINKCPPTRIPYSDDAALHGKNILLFAQTWALANKYLLPRLQNAIMKEFLNHFQNFPLPLDSNLVNRLLNISPADTPLRRILSEETVHLIYAKKPNKRLPGQRMKASELVASDGTAGLSGSLLEAFDVFVRNKRRIERMTDPEGEELELYREYLVEENVVKEKGVVDKVEGGESDGTWKG